MKTKNCTGLCIQPVIITCAFLFLTLGTHAKDVRDPILNGLASTSGIQSSPFEPPTQDVFVTNSGPGLDTGCTYNDKPEHPLIIEIPIDRYVGEVDEEGYLKDPASLVAKGIIPMTVQVGMPAYDVDVNTDWPPERDDVLLNGKYVYTLSGDDDRWEYNFFAVDIGKIKFPAEPSQVAINQVQVNVDVLSKGNWCTAIDWVAFHLKIQQMALSLKPMYGRNKIRVNDRNSDATLDIIYEDFSEGLDCGTLKENYPFSGPMGKFIGLMIELKPCSTDTTLPKNARVTWKIEGLDIEPVESFAFIDLSTSTYTSMDMPSKVGAYSVSFDVILDSRTVKTVESPLFVTKKSPELKEIPRLAWYEKAINWADGEQKDEVILSKLQTGVHNFGRSNNWRYGYCFGGRVLPFSLNGRPLCIGAPSQPEVTCSWEDLIDENSITCDYGDCHVFGKTLATLSGVLGISLSQIVPRGSNNEGFITVEGLSSYSIDPVFSGNVRLQGGNAYDRYYFKDHNLQKLGSKFYDATFNGTYLSETAFIDYNILQEFSAADDTKYYTTDEGVTIYTVEKPRDGGYPAWGKYEYTPPPSTKRASQRQTRDAAVNAQSLRLMDKPSFQMVDTNNDGLAEALVVELQVEISKAGSYFFEGVLQKNGQRITNTPFYHVTMSTWAVLKEESPGIYPVQLGFSGEEILLSDQDGPYELQLTITGTDFAMTPKFLTPSYKHTQFAEVGAIIKEITDASIDENGDGKFDFLETTVTVEVRSPGEYSLISSLRAKEESITNMNVRDSFTLTPGTHPLKLRFPGQWIRRFGLDGPYNGVMDLYEANGNEINDFSFITSAYRSADFEVLLELDGTFKDQGIDTNGNGLFESLQVEIGADITEAGTFMVIGTLTNAVKNTGRQFVYTNTLMTLSRGPQILTFNFSGSHIHELKMNGPYEVRVNMREPNTFKELDEVWLEPVTAKYNFTEFEPLGGKVIRPISLTGNSVDKGIDTNGNDLFDELHVEIEVQLTTSDFYEWSARLMDANGTRVDFDSRRAWLNAGTATIDLVFDGNLIARNGIDGPYLIMGLLMFGQSGPNLVSLDVAKTQAYLAKQFEGPLGLSVELDSFVAVSNQEDIQLTWTTGIEQNNAGFRLWRAIENDKQGYAVIPLGEKQPSYHTGCADGLLVTTNEDSSPLIRAVGHSREGACYDFTDNSITQDGTYYYVLEDIDTAGKRVFHCDAIAAATRGKGLAIDLEAAKNYCWYVTGKH